MSSRPRSTRPEVSEEGPPPGESRDEVDDDPFRDPLTEVVPERVGDVERPEPEMATSPPRPTAGTVALLAAVVVIVGAAVVLLVRAGGPPPSPEERARQ